MKTQAKTSLRDGYRDQTRTRILDAAIAEMGASSVEQLTIANVAKRAGVTERTVFRHFETRDQLISAVWPRMQARVRSVGFPTTAQALIETPRRLFPAFDEEAGLVRATAFSAAGREVRMASNPERQKAMRASVRDAFPGIKEPELTRIAAAVQLLDSAYAWAVMKDFWGLDGEEAGRAASEAIAVLVGLRPPGPETASKPKSKTKAKKETRK